MDDLQARLDRAITNKRRELFGSHDHMAYTPAARCPLCDAIDDFEALVALRARYEAFEDVSIKHRDRDDSRHHLFCPGCTAQRRRLEELDTEAEHLQEDA